MIRNLDGLLKNLRGIARNKSIDMLSAGGTSNHVHLLLRLPPVRGLSEAVRDLKANSSRYMSETGGRFAWQEGTPPSALAHRRFARYARISKIRNGTTPSDRRSRSCGRCWRRQACRTRGNTWWDVAADAAPGNPTPTVPAVYTAGSPHRALRAVESVAIKQLASSEVDRRRKPANTAIPDRACRR
jgi:REP element-mobilizing transposase RayT